MSGFASASSKAPVGDQTSQVSLALSMSGGGCTLGIRATPGTPGTVLPGSLTIMHAAGRIKGRTACAASAAAAAVDANIANAYPPSGAVTLTYNEINPADGLHYSSKMYLALAGQPDQIIGTPAVQLYGMVTGGVGQGLAVTWNIFFDPVDPKTGLYDANQYGACTDSTPGNASITKFMIGDGTSPNGNTADGLTAIPTTVCASCPP
jgi:hypothetical protein